MERVGVRELRQYASEYLRRVADGESFEVTDRKRAVARLVPIEGDSALDRLKAAGRLSVPQGDLLDAPEPVPLPKGSRSASEILHELREGER
jgi:prevent-host-death family protein